MSVGGRARELCIVDFEGINSCQKKFLCSVCSEFVMKESACDLKVTSDEFGYMERTKKDC